MANVPSAKSCPSYTKMTFLHLKWHKVDWFQLYWLIWPRQQVSQLFVYTFLFTSFLSTMFCLHFFRYRSANTGWDTQGDTTENISACLPRMSQIHRFGNGNGPRHGNFGKIPTFCPKIKCVRQSFRTIPHQNVWHDHRFFWSEISWVHVEIFQDPPFEM